MNRHYTHEPTSPHRNTTKGYVVCVTFDKGATWRFFHKTYETLWSCLRFGCEWFHVNSNPYYVMELSTGELVHKSWKDENKYHMTRV